MGDDPESEPNVLFSLPREWWAYVRGPATFLASRDLSSGKAVRRATGTFWIGVGGMVAMSAVNLKFSPLAKTEATKRLFEGSVTTTALLIGCAVIALLSHLVALALRGSGRWRETYVTNAVTFAYVWPMTALVLISTTWLLRLMTGIPWTALPPYEVPGGGVMDQSLKNILLVAAIATIDLWFVGFVLYCFVCAVQAAHGLGRIRAGIAVVAVFGVSFLLGSPISRLAYVVAETFGPLIDWFRKLI